MIDLIIEKGYLISRKRVSKPLYVKSCTFMQYFHLVI